MRRLFRLAVAGIAGILVPVSVPVASGAPDHTSTDAYQARASMWLGHALSQTDDIVMTEDGSRDYLTTLYSILGLAQMGYGAEQIHASAQALADEKDELIGTPDVAASKTTEIALLMIAAATANLDLTEYTTDSGPRNLEADLRATVHEDGQVGEPASIRGQALTILALSLTPDGVPPVIRQWLLDRRCDDQSDQHGAYGGCTAADPDATAIAVRALMATGSTDSTNEVEASVEYLIAAQDDDTGGYAREDEKVNAATTGLVTWALGSCVGVVDNEDMGTAITRAQEYLMSLAYPCDTVASDGHILPSEAAPIQATQLMGAIPLDAESRTRFSASTPADSLPLLMSSTAHAILGLGKWTAGLPTISIGVEQTLPTSSCPVQEPTKDSVDEEFNDTGSGYGWLYGIGGFLVMAGIFVGWRFLLAQRRG